MEGMSRTPYLRLVTGILDALENEPRAHHYTLGRMRRELSAELRVGQDEVARIVSDLRAAGAIRLVRDERMPRWQRLELVMPMCADVEACCKVVARRRREHALKQATDPLARVGVREQSSAPPPRVRTSTPGRLGKVFLGP